MAIATVNGVSIAYDDIQPAGAERTILLIHGFASNRNEGWRRTGWYGAFERRRTRMIALDQRGHGESQKFHEPEAYLRENLATDALALLDHLGVGRCDVFGYSMGTRTAMEIGLTASDRAANVILGGIGGRMFEGPRASKTGETIAQAMLADDPATVQDGFLRSFRQFADEQGEDRQALAAVSQVKNPPVDWDGLARLPMPVFVVAGQFDDGAGDPETLARHFPHGKSKVVPGCDHFSAIPHALTKAAVFDFLDGMLDDDFPPFE